MTSKKRLLAVAMTALMCLSAVASAGAVGSTAANDSVANDSLVVAVEQAGNDGATVTVTQNHSTVENASVTVQTVGNDTYAGVGDYVTDENGTVGLPAPNETVTVEVTAAKGNLTGNATAELTAAAEEENDDGEGEKKGTFGQLVSSFVQEMLNGGKDDGALGQLVSEYVTSNNPGSEKKADHAGKPDDAGKPDHAGKSDDAGSPNATDDGERGPPDHAGPDGDESDDGEEGDENTGEEDDENDDERGNGKKSDNGKKNGHDKNKSNGKDH